MSKKIVSNDQAITSFFCGQNADSSHLTASSQGYLYSYSLLIAKLDGDTLYVLHNKNPEAWSNTTKKHIRKVREIASILAPNLKVQVVMEVVR